MTYALLAGVISRMIFLPFGDLSNTPLTDRMVAVAIALVTFFVGRRNVLVGVSAGTAAFIVLVIIRGEI